MSEKIYTAKNSGAIFVQPNGPNTAPTYVGCHDLEDFDEGEGGISLYRCFSNGEYKTLGFSSEAPDPISVTLGTYTGPVRELIENMKFPGAIHVLLRDRGVANLFTNWRRMVTLNVAKRSQKSRSNWSKREEDGSAMTSVTMEALPPVFDLSQFKILRQTTAETQILNAIAFFRDGQGWNAPGGAKDGKQNAFIGASSAAGPATANVLKTVNGGGAWAAVTDPFGAGEHIGPVITFPISASANRIIVGRALTDAGNPPEIAYSDDNGATWTTVSLGSTNALFFRAGPGGLFYLDYYHIWAVVSGGGIFFSGDGGLSWTQQGAGVSSSALNFVRFVDSKNGYIGGAADTILKTVDGGTTWATATATGNGGDVFALFVADENRVWVGTDDGELFYSLDGATTWAEREFTGGGAGDVKGIEFLTPYFGLMIHDTAAPVGAVHLTKDGGYTWEPIETPTNAGLNAITILDEETFFVVGAPSGGTAVILKGYAN